MSNFNKNVNLMFFSFDILMLKVLTFLDFFCCCKEHILFYKDLNKQKTLQFISNQQKRKTTSNK